jgi:hypothetical protein
MPATLTESGQVRVSAETYRKLETKGQERWKVAVARELIQNGSDAGATTIDIVTTDTTITCTDNGCGFTLEAARKFMDDGWSSKDNDETTIGGFGAARRLLCFAQESYTIRSRNLVITGSGVDWTITADEDLTEDDASWVAGTEFFIELTTDDDEADGVPVGVTVTAAVSDITNASDIGAAVRLNGYRAYGTRTARGRAKRKLEDGNGRVWSRAYEVKNGIGYVYVRAGGLLMFEKRRYGANDDIILEVEPRRVTEVFTVNRDGLRAGFREQFDEWVRDLDQNSRKALKQPAPPLRARVGDGSLMTSRPALDAVAVPADVDAIVATPGTLPGLDERTSNLQESPREEEIVRRARSTARWAPAPETFTLVDLEGRPTITHGLPCDVFLIADSNDAAVRAQARKWSPERWSETVGTRRRTLLHAWFGAVNYSIELLLQLAPGIGEVTWAVGFTFDLDIEASCLTRDGSHVLSVRPFDKNGRTAFKVSQTADMRRMLSLAVHEVAHIVVSGHNEHFAGVQTDLWGYVDQAEAFRRMRAGVTGLQH